MMASIMKSKSFRIAFTVLFWTAVWYIAALAIGSEYFLPYPHSAAHALFRLFGESVFWKSIGHSFFTILSGCLLGCILGILMAAGAAYSRLMHSVIAPMITVLRATPVASFIILVYVIVRRIDLNVSAVSLVIVVIMVIPIIYTNLYTAFTSFDKKLTEVARIYQFSFWKKISILWFPQTKPYLVSSVSNALGYAWKAGVAAEVICILPYTIGKNLYDAKYNLEMDRLFAWTITVVLLSLFFEFLLKRTVNTKRQGGGKK